VSVTALAGGFVALPLLSFSLVAVALIVERLLFWSRISRRQRAVAREALHLYATAPPLAAERLRQQRSLPIARIFLAALELPQPTPDEFRLALESAAQAEIPVLKRFNTGFETIVSAAPLLGLLGTILGLMRAFASLDLGNPNSTAVGEVTAGLSEALVSTVLGLVVAIATLLFASLFRSLYQRQFAFIQEYGGQLELLHRRHYEQARSRSVSAGESQQF